MKYRRNIDYIYLYHFPQSLPLQYYQGFSDILAKRRRNYLNNYHITSQKQGKTRKM